MKTNEVLWMKKITSSFAGIAICILVIYIYIHLWIAYSTGKYSTCYNYFLIFVLLLVVNRSFRGHVNSLCFEIFALGEVQTSTAHQHDDHIQLQNRYLNFLLTIARIVIHFAFWLMIYTIKRKDSLPVGK
jgi:hypothetical protein